MDCPLSKCQVGKFVATSCEKSQREHVPQEHKGICLGVAVVLGWSPHTVSRSPSDASGQSGANEERKGWDYHWVRNKKLK